MNKIIIVIFSVFLTFLYGQSAPSHESPHHEGQALVWLKKDVDVELFIEKANQTFGWPIEIAMPVSNHFNIWLFSFDPNITGGTYAALLAFRTLPEVGTAQLNHILSIRIAPNDPSYTSQQWQYNNTGQNGGTPGSDIKAELAWNVSTGGLTTHGDTIVVAVIDDGFQRNHPDLLANMWVNHHEIPGNGIDDDGNGYVDDVFGWNAYNNNGNITSSQHGTHVSGIIGAVGNNGIGGTGVNWKVKIMPIQGSSNNEATVVAAYAYAATMREIYNSTQGSQGAFVVSTNSSFGVDYGNPANFPIWCSFYDTLGVRGILSAGAGPNLNVNVDLVGDVPSTCPSLFLIGVTNTTRNDQQNAGSGYGPVHIDLGAPGTQVWNTVPNNTYSALTGTSMATPHVAGAIALYYSAACSVMINHYKQNPGAIALTMRQFLLNGVDIIPALTNRTSTNGRLNIWKGIQEVQSYPCNPNAPPVAGFYAGSQSGCPGLEVHFNQFSIGNVDSVKWIFQGGVPSQSNLNNPIVNYYQIGLYDVTLIAFNAFGSDTLVMPQYISINNQGVKIILKEDFEVSSFSQTGWSVINPGGSSTWNLVNTQGNTPGSQSAGINIFQFQQEIGETDTLLSPPFSGVDFTSLELRIQHAHRRRVSSVRDSLFILAWSDQQPQPVSLARLGESGQGTFATAGLLNSNFIPSNSSDWCFSGNIVNCYTLSMNAFDGHDNIRIAFVALNQGGNNIYLDNIHVSGVCTGPPSSPIATIESNKDFICEGENIIYSDHSLFNPQFWNWTFAGGLPSSSTLPTQTVFYPNTGLFQTQLVVSNAIGNDTAFRSITVHPKPLSPQLIYQGDTLFAPSGFTYTWFVSGNLIPGAHSNFYVPSSNGNYSVQITNEWGCSSQSNAVGFVLGNSKLTPLPMYVYPNPGTGVYFLRGNAVPAKTASLFDLSGRGIGEYRLDTNGKIDLSSIPSGTYILKVRDLENHKHFLRVVKNP